MEYKWSDKMHNRSRTPMLWVRDMAGRPVEFTGKPIVGRVAVKSSQYYKSGKWSCTDYVLVSPDTAVVVEQLRPFEGWGCAWADIAKGFTPLVADVDREAFAREVASVWPKTEGALYDSVQAARENEAALASIQPTESVRESVLVNLTQHKIVIRAEGQLDMVIEPTAPAARMAVKSVADGTIEGVPVYRQEFGKVENLPEPTDGVVFVTSTLIAQAVKRFDVVSPDTGPTAIRENGQVVAVRGLQAF